MVAREPEALAQLKVWAGLRRRQMLRIYQTAPRRQRRPVCGKIRYMSLISTSRKFNSRAYIAA
jgi:hypothetical protein